MNNLELTKQIWNSYYTNSKVGFTQELYIPVTRPQKIHKKSRIQKKWLRRFGEITTYKIQQIPLDSFISYYTRVIIVSYINTPIKHKHTIAIVPELRYSISDVNPSELIKFKTKEYELQPIGCNLQISAEVYLQMRDLDKLSKYLKDRFEKQAFDYLLDYIENYVDRV